MKVLFFVASFPCISETFVLNQVTGLLDKGHDVRIFSWGMPDTNTPHEDVVKYNLKERVTYLKRPIPQNKALRLIKVMPFLSKGLASDEYRIRPLISTQFGKFASNLTLLYIAESLKAMKWRPDAVVSHFGDNGLIVSSMKRAKIVDPSTKHYVFFHAHELCRMNANQLANYYRPLFESNDLILPISDYWRRILLKSGANEENLKVFHMGIDSDKFPFHTPKETLDKIHILSVGRLVGQKGYEHSLQAIADFAASSMIDVDYTIIGDGPLNGKLRKLADKLGISNIVCFMGAQKQEVVSQCLAMSDVFLLPSVADDDGYMEGIPVALMEAMAMGKICVSTYHSGIPELIENNKTGFLCNERNSDDIVNALETIVRMSKYNLEQISKSAREMVVNKFNVRTLIDDLDKMLSSEQ